MSRAQRLALLFALLTGAAATTLPALGGPFTLDDLSVHANASARTPVSFLAPATLLPTTRAASSALQAMETALFGHRPAPFRLISLALHLTACVGLARVLRRLDRPPGERAFAALLFASHPMQAGTVPYVSAQSGLLCAALSLWALQHGLAAGDPRAGRRAFHAGSAVGLALLAILAKEIALVLPVAMGVLERLARPVPDRAARRRGTLLLAMQVPVLLAVGSDLSGIWGDESARVSSFVSTQLEVIPGGIIADAFLPHGLEIHYDVAPLLGRGPVPPTAIASLAFWPLLGGTLLLTLWRARYVAALLLWSAVWLAPTNSIVPLQQVRFDHHVYLSLAGGCAAAAWAAERLGGAGRWGGAAIALLLASQTPGRAALWNRPATLWAGAVTTSPRDPLPHHNLAYVRHAQRGAPRALHGFLRAWSLGRNPKSLGSAASCLLDLGRPDDAAAALREALRMEPRLLPFWAGLARIEYVRGDLAAAREAGREAISRGGDAGCREVLRHFLTPAAGDPDAWDAAVGSARDAGRSDIAVELAVQAADRFPGDARFR